MGITSEKGEAGGRLQYLKAGEAAELLHVSPKTVSRWAKEGRIRHVVTLGGHRRFDREDIEKLVEQLGGR